MGIAAKIDALSAWIDRCCAGEFSNGIGGQRFNDLYSA